VLPSEQGAREMRRSVDCDLTHGARTSSGALPALASNRAGLGGLLNIGPSIPPMPPAQANTSHPLPRLLGRSEHLAAPRTPVPSWSRPSRGPCPTRTGATQQKHEGTSSMT